jgi:anti-sigma factor RsiW
MNDNPSLCDRVESDPRGEGWGSEAAAHAADCPTCQAFLAGHGELTRRLRGLPLATESMPAGLRGSLLAQLEACQPDRGASARTTARRGWSGPVFRRLVVPVALAASLFLGVFLERNFDLRPGGPAPEVRRNIGMYIQDVTHDHYLLARITRPLEVPFTDPGELSRWLSTSLNFGFELPRTGRTFALEGGRVWHTLGRLSALASYVTEEGERAILFAVPANNLDLRGAPSTMIGGTRVYTGSAWGNEAHVWVAGDLAIALTAPKGKLPAAWIESFLP